MWMPGPGIKPRSPALAGRSLTTGPPGKPCAILIFALNKNRTYNYRAFANTVKCQIKWTKWTKPLTYYFPQILQIKDETENQNILLVGMVIQTNPPCPEAWANVHLTPTPWILYSMKTLQDPSSTNLGFTFTLVRKANGLGRSLGWEDPLEKEMATHSNCPGNPIAWKIPWTEEAGRLQSTGSQKVRHDGATSLSLSRKANTETQWIRNSNLPVNCGFTLKVSLWKCITQEDQKTTWKHLKFLSWSWVGLLFLLFLFFFLLSGWLLLGNWRNYWCHTRICPSKTNKTLLDVICHSSLTTRPGLTSLAQGLGKRKEQEKC